MPDANPPAPTREELEKRPWWCQDPTCTPDAMTPNAASDNPGHSGWCCGRVPAPLETVRHGERHVNDGHFCFRSPVRGVVMLEINEPDLDLIARVALRSLVKRGAQGFNWRWYTGRTDAD